MSQSTIIELRQLNSDNVDRNGVYSTTLDPNSAVLLEEGDQVNIKAIYLDTAESSAGFIHLDEDLECELEMGLYIQNYNKDQLFVKSNGSSENLRQYPNAGRTLNERGDNDIWWLAEHSNNGTATNWDINSMTLQTIPGKPKTTKDITINFEYTPITAGAKPVIRGKTIRHTSKDQIALDNPFALGFVCTGTATAPAIKRITTDAELKAAGFSVVSLNYTAKPTGEEHFELQTFPINFTIPAGDYTPAEISKTITDKIANIEQNGNVDDFYGSTSATNPPTKTLWTANSPFLTSILENITVLNAKDPSLGQAFVNASTENGATAGQLYMTYNIAAMVAEYNGGDGGSPVSGYLPPVDRYVGANEVALAFDGAENKLKWETIHFPIYVNGTSDTANDAVPGVIYNNAITQPGVYQVNTGLATKYAGVAFTKMEPQNFWAKQLGFSNIIITPQTNASLKYPNAAAPLPATPNSFTIECKDGVNMTGAFPGLDIGVQHNNLNYSQPVFHNLNGDDLDSTISTQDSTSIFSTRVWNSSLADEGYFLVEVSPNFNQNMVGASGVKSKNTMSIVNRYYTQNSFTSDQGAGSISYTHTGESQLLSDLSVAVRNPDRSFVNTNILQDKNTIFVEIIKRVGEDVSNPKKQ